MTSQCAALPRTETLLNSACDPAHSRCMPAAAAPARAAVANGKSGAQALLALA